MKTEKMICRMIDKKHKDVIYNGFMLRFEEECTCADNKMTVCSWIRDRLLFLGYTCLLPFFLFQKRNKFFVGKNSKISVTIGSKNTDDINVKIWKNYVKYYFKENVECFGAKSWVEFNIRYAWRAFVWWCGCVAVAACSWADFRGIPFRSVAFLWHSALSMILSQDKINNIFAFYLCSSYSYLLTMFLSSHNICKLNIMTGSNDLYVQRFIVAENANMYLMSKIQIPEYDYYCARGEIYSKNVKYLGCTDVFEVSRDKKIQNTIDIGIFSDGCFARDEYGMRKYDPEWIRKNLESGRRTLWGKYEDELYDEVYQYAKKKGLTLKYYPHPFERELMELYGIKPPFLEKVDGRKIFFDDSKRKTSMKLLGEPKVAVTLVSTSVLQRIDMGYERNICFNYNILTERTRNSICFLHESMGKYKDVFISDIREVNEKLDFYFGEVRKAYCE